MKILVSLMAAVLVGAAPPVSAEQYELLIVGGNLFRTETGDFVINRGIGIHDGRFINLDVDPETNSATRTITLDDSKFILPGLIDCHAHYNVKLIGKRREEFNVIPVQYLANGVTVTFSCGEFDPEGMLQLGKRIEEGKQPGPRLLNSGPYFGRARPGWRGQKTEQEIRDEVDFWAGRGVGGFKAKAISPDELRVLIDQAHKHGLTVTGHLDSGFRGSVNPRDAIGMGIDRIEHFLGGDAMPDDVPAYTSLAKMTANTPEYREIVQLYVDRGIWYDATLTAYGYFGSPHEEFEPWIDERQFFTPFIQQQVRERGPDKPVLQFEQIYQAKQKMIGEFFRAGGQISLGTDHFSNGNYLPGFGAHRELDAFVRNGIPPADAIRIGTINGAKALGIDADHGSIAIGKSADLFVITGNPLENIRHTRSVETVVVRGEIHSSRELLDGIVGKLGPKSMEESADW